MHVLYIHQHFTTRQGTGGTRSYEMARRLLSAGHEVTMLCGVGDRLPADMVRRSDQRVRRFDIDGINVIQLAEAYSNSMAFWARVAAFLRFAVGACHAAGGVPADLVFATSTPLTVGIPGVYVARMCKIPFVFEVRDLWPDLPIALGKLKNPLLQAASRGLERFIYSEADKIVALSPGMVDGIVRAGVAPGKISMIPNGCDLDLFRRDGEVRPLKGPCRFVFAGAHGFANGLDTVLDAAAELIRREESGIEFVLIGAGGEKARLMARASQEGLGHLVKWRDPVPKEELGREFARSAVGLMILRNCREFYDGTSPNKFFDYIASGLPVLCNYPGWLGTMVEETGCGLVVRPEDAAALADAVVWLRDHESERQMMGKNARALAEASFSRDALGQALVSALEAVHRDYAEGRRR